MRLRRSAPIVLAAVVLLSACGQDAPEFGAGPDTTAPAEAGSGLDVGENAAGLVGTMAPSTTVPPTSTTVAPSTSTTAVPGPPDPAVQAICDRVSIFLVTASGLGPNPSPADAQMLHDSVSQLLDDGALLYSVLNATDQARMTDCLDQAVQAAPA
jgi:hypothetical protein